MFKLAIELHAFFLINNPPSRLKNSNQLETSLQNGKTLLSTFENKLAREEVAPADLSSLEKTQRELAVSWLCHSFSKTKQNKKKCDNIPFLGNTVKGDLKNLGLSKCTQELVYMFSALPAVTVSQSHCYFQQ